MRAERGDYEKETWCSHAWIEGAGLIVDITADQFPEITEPVLVLPVGSSPWHATFRDRQTIRADYRLYDDGTREQMEKATRLIQKNL